MSYNTFRFDNDLSIYYKNLFPFKPFVKWLQYGKKTTEYFNRREFAFILADDVHLRYKSFNDVLAFQRALCSTNPHKLDLGAVYNYMPSENKKHADFQAIEREFVFDIDLTDYDVVRNCCKDAKVCSKCWKFVVLAVRILDHLLVTLFDFRSRMWVFSGRRGVHCWIGDKKARLLNNSARSAIASRLNLFKKNNRCDVTEARKKITVVPPIVSEAFQKAMEGEMFEEMIFEQGWLDDPASALEYPYMTMAGRNTLENMMRKADTPKLRWQALLRMYDEETRRKLVEQGESIPDAPFGRDRNVLRYFVLQRIYPRLDVNVSTGTNHLLKSPFCVHPKTGNVAVPLEVETIADFDVEDCPRIDKLVSELKELPIPMEDQENRKTLAYKHGSLAKYVETFEKFVDVAIVS